jgi:O-antigen ligase
MTTLSQKPLSVTTSVPRMKLARRVNPYATAAVLLGVLAGVLVVWVNQPDYILLALAALIVFLLALYSKEFGLVVLIFISYTRFSDTMTEFQGVPSTAKPYLAILIVAILMRWAIFREIPKGWGNPAVLFGILALTGFASLLYSPVPDRVTVRLLNDLKDMLIATVIVILLQNGPSLRRALWTLLAAGFFLGTLSVFQYFTGTFDHVYWGFAQSSQHQIVGAVDDYRATGPIGDPNFFAQIMVVLIPIALERYLHEKKTVLRLIALWTMGVSVLTVLFTYSRGGFLAMVIGVLILFSVYPPKRIQVPFVFFLIVIFVSYLPANYVDRLSTLSEIFKPTGTSRLEERSLQGRLSENLAAWEMIKSNPVFGVGLNSYKYLFPLYSKKQGLALVATEREAHNMFLEVAAETGVVGFSVFAFLLFFCYRTLINARTIFLRSGLGDYAGMTVGFLAGLSSYLVAGIFIHNAFPRYFYLLLGMALSFRLVALNSAEEVYRGEGEAL